MSGSNVASQSVQATLILVAGNLGSNILLFVAVLIIARLLGPSAYGEYALVLIPPSILILFSGVGVHTAITRDAAFFISRKEIEIARRKTVNQIVFLISLGAILSIIAFAIAPEISSIILRRPSLTFLVQFSSLTLFGQILLQSGVAALVGWGSIKSTALIYVVQAAAKVILSPLLVLLGYGVIGAIIGQAISLLVAGVFSVVVIWKTRLRSTRPFEASQFFQDVKEGIRYGLPSEIGNYASNFATQNFLLLAVAIFASNLVVGYFQAAVNVTVLVSLISTATSFALFRAFSTLQGQSGDTEIAFRYAVKYSAYSITPLILFLAVASKPILTIVYGNAYASAFFLLSIILLANTAISFGFSVFPSYFNGISKTRYTMIAFLSQSIVLLLLAPLLGVYFGAYGIALALLVANYFAVAIALCLCKTTLNSMIDIAASILSLAASGISSVAAYSFVYLGLSSPIILGFQFLVFFSVYLVIAPLLGVINQNDILRLEQSAEDLGPLRHVFKKILDFESRVIKTFW